MSREARPDKYRRVDIWLDSQSKPCLWQLQWFSRGSLGRHLQGAVPEGWSVVRLIDELATIERNERVRDSWWQGLVEDAHPVLEPKRRAKVVLDGWDTFPPFAEGHQTAIFY